MGVGRTGFGWDADGGSVVGTGGGGGEDGQEGDRDGLSQR